MTVHCGVRSEFGIRGRRNQEAVLNIISQNIKYLIMSGFCKSVQVCTYVMCVRVACYTIHTFAVSVIIQ